MSGPPDIAVRLGRCDEMRAEVHLRACETMPDGSRLSGVVVGPHRGRDVTLPITARLLSLSSAQGGGQPAARVVVTEPAFWTPDLPNLYRLHARLECPGLEPQEIDTTFGLRRFGVRGRSFWLDGRRWVLRGVSGSGDAAAAKQAGVGLVTADPADPLLSEADRIGVAVVALLGWSDMTATRIAALARHPSVLMAMVVDRERPEQPGVAEAEVRRAKDTLQIGLATTVGPPDTTRAGAFDFLAVIVPAGTSPDEAWRNPLLPPLVAWQARSAVGMPVARAACSDLQRDLAAWGLEGVTERAAWDWAGYVVGPAE